MCDFDKNDGKDTEDVFLLVFLRDYLKAAYVASRVSLLINVGTMWGFSLQSYAVKIFAFCVKIKM